MFFNYEYEEEQTTIKIFSDKYEALNHWNNYGGYFLILTDNEAEETVYIIEDFECEVDEYRELEESIIQVIKHRSDDVFPYCSQVIYEDDFLNRVDSYAV